MTLLALVERVRAVELRLAAKRPLDVHALGNALQVVQLGLANVAGAPAQLSEAAARASAALAALVATPPREVGPPIAPAIRDAIATATAALASMQIALRCELPDEVTSHLAADELAALALGFALDALGAVRIELLLRERAIEGRRWIELVRTDDRVDLALRVAPPSWLFVADALARAIGGELTLSPGRRGRELVFAWPAA